MLRRVPQYTEDHFDTRDRELPHSPGFMGEMVGNDQAWGVTFRFYEAVIMRKEEEERMKGGELPLLLPPQTGNPGEYQPAWN